MTDKTISKKRDRRFLVGLPLVADVRLMLWAHTQGTSRTRMSEILLMKMLTEDVNSWGHVRQLLIEEAAILRVPVEELVKQILKSNKLDEDIDVDEVDWSVFFPLEGEIEFTTEEGTE